MSGSTSIPAASVPAEARAASLIQGTGELAAMIRAKDWSATSLGALEQWPDTLLAMVNTVLESPNPYALHWGADHLLFYNDVYRAFLGTKHPASLGAPAAEVWPEAWATVGPLLEAAYREGTVAHAEKALIPILIDGRMEDRWWSYCMLPVYHRGQIAGVFAPASEDKGMLETMAAEHAVARAAQRDEQFSVALEAAGLATWYYDLEREVVGGDEAMLRLFGMTQAETAAADFLTKLHADDQRRVTEEFTAALSGMPYDTEFRIMHGQGFLRVRSKARMMTYEGKSRLVGICEDVTARRAKDEDLQAMHERLELARLASGIAIWDWDLKSGNIFWTGGSELVYGRPAEQVSSGDACFACIYPDDVDELSAALRPALAGESGATFEFRVVWPDGSVHWVMGRANPVMPGGGGKSQRVVGINMDITERKLREAALIQSEKLAAVGRLASSIAHEINNPLEAVTNLLYLARTSDDLDEIRTYLLTADGELRRTSSIASQTLRFHKQSSRPRPVSCEDLISSVLAVYQARITNSRVTVEKRKRAHAPVVCFDGEIRQVLSNLVGNAIDAMHGTGGRLLMRSREATHWTKEKSGERGLMITVADTGSGMSAETVKKAFAAFFTTKGESGTGLGLWISKEIVDRHHGRMLVRSSQRPGRSGTVFTIFLPYDAVIR